MFQALLGEAAHTLDIVRTLNLADDPEYADRLESHRETVEAWMEATDDRLLEGKWPPSDVQEERVWKSPWIPRHDGRHC